MAAAGSFSWAVAKEKGSLQPRQHEPIAPATVASKCGAISGTRLDDKSGRHRSDGKKEHVCLHAEVHL